MDFPEVLGKKISAISRRQNLWPMLDVNSMEELTVRGATGMREVRTKHCRMVQADMRIAPWTISHLFKPFLEVNSKGRD